VTDKLGFRIALPADVGQVDTRATSGPSSIEPPNPTGSCPGLSSSLATRRSRSLPGSSTSWMDQAGGSSSMSRLSVSRNSSSMSCCIRACWSAERNLLNPLSRNGVHPGALGALHCQCGHVSPVPPEDSQTGNGGLAGASGEDETADPVFLSQLLLHDAVADPLVSRDDDEADSPYDGRPVVVQAPPGYRGELGCPG
jgi:hypothetical protein